jgi:hypothetical protein
MQSMAAPLRVPSVVEWQSESCRNAYLATIQYRSWLALSNALDTLWQTAAMCAYGQQLGLLCQQPGFLSTSWVCREAHVFGTENVHGWCAVYVHEHAFVEEALIYAAVSAWL